MQQCAVVHRCAAGRSRQRCAWRSRRRECSSVPSSIAAPPSVDGGAVALTLQQLSTHGFVVVKLSADVVSLMGDLRRCMKRFFGGTIREKDAYRTRQEGDRVLSHPGYLTPSPGWSELFEVRCSARDRSYKFPPACETPCSAVFEALRRVCIDCLAHISAHLTGDAAFLPRLVSHDSAPSVLRVLHYDQVPELHAQLQTLNRGERAQGEARLRAAFPAHTDGSLLTLGPRGTCAGLMVRDYASGEWVDVEAAMAEDEACLFCGDPLAFLSRHHFPSCMHQPDALLMAQHAPTQRLSMPFFLYPDVEATLDASRTRPSLRAAGGKPLYDAGAGAAVVRAADLPLNVGGVRSKWAWKREEYYAGLVMADDANPFPGVQEQYVPRAGYG